MRGTVLDGESAADFEEVTDTHLRPLGHDEYRLRVEAMIRQRYSMSDELAILRQRNAKPEEFEAYYAWCEACKAQARDSNDF